MRIKTIHKKTAENVQFKPPDGTDKTLSTPCSKKCQVVLSSKTDKTGCVYVASQL